MSNPSPSSNGKGSARRKENLAKIRDNWDSIDWSKGRPAAKKLREDFGEVAGRVLLEDYSDSGKKVEWVIPPIEELLVSTNGQTFRVSKDSGIARDIRSANREDSDSARLGRIL